MILWANLQKAIGVELAMGRNLQIPKKNHEIVKQTTATHLTVIFQFNEVVGLFIN